MEPKKISFGFSKSKKPSSIIKKPSPEKNVEYITSFDGERKCEQKQELIIPVKPNYSVAERIAAKRKREAEAQNKTTDSTMVDSKNVSLETLAIHELINDSKKIPESGDPKLTIPVVDKFDEEIELAEEPDYDCIPVADFGYAMLRGMGWAPGKGIGKNQEVVEVKVPKLRPRGLGLGADALASDSKS